MHCMQTVMHIVRCNTKMILIFKVKCKTLAACREKKTFKRSHTYKKYTKITFFIYSDDLFGYKLISYLSENY